MIRDISQLDPKGTYTYADYLQWQFEETVELIKGHLYRMSPAPRMRHQRILMRLSGRLYNYFEEARCQVFPAPFDVRLPNPDFRPGQNEKIYTVVQPDISVICDKSKLDEMGCLGAPDWIIEIASPSTQKKDFNEKYNLYEAAGVREYWIVMPELQTINIYKLEEGTYQDFDFLERTGIAYSALFPEIGLDLGSVFAD